MAAILVLTGIILTRILLFYCLTFSYTSEIKNAWILLDYFVEKSTDGKITCICLSIFMDFHIGLSICLKIFDFSTYRPYMSLYDNI